MNIKKMFCNTKLKEFSLKLYHLKLFTKNKFAIMSKSNNKCNLCNKIEDIFHVLYECETAKIELNWLNTWIYLLFDLRIDDELNYFFDINQNNLSYFMFIKLFQFILWKYRCNYNINQKNFNSNNFRREFIEEYSIIIQISFNRTQKLIIKFPDKEEEYIKNWNKIWNPNNCWCYYKHNRIYFNNDLIKIIFK